MTLKYTLAQARDRELAHVGTVGIPTKWWPLTYGSDCLGFQLFCLGVRSRADMELKHISIAEFLDTTTWDRVTADEIRPGDLAFQNWVGNTAPDHVGMTYSRVAKPSIVTIEANTGPAAGVEAPRGAWKKTRPVGDWLVFGVRPPYKDAAATVTTKRRTEVRAVAAYLNTHLGGPDSAAADDGIPGPIYWTLVQTWGRAHALYPSQYIIDGVPGTQTRKVEAKVYSLTKKG